jgi:hypothetical protein
MEWPDGFLSEDFDRELRDFWQQINSMTVLNREMVKLTDREVVKAEFVTDLANMRIELLGWINRIHEMTGPMRLEMKTATVLASRTPDSPPMDLPADFIIGDIKAALNVLEERLKG